MYKFGKLHNSSNELVYDPVIYDKYEFILVSILLKYLLGLERLTIKTKDILSEEVDEIGSVETVNCKYPDSSHEAGKKKIVHQLNKLLLSLATNSQGYYLHLIGDSLYNNIVVGIFLWKLWIWSINDMFLSCNGNGTYFIAYLTFKKFIAKN